MRTFLRNILSLLVLTLSSHVFSYVSNPAFLETNISITTRKSYIPKQSMAPIQTETEQSGCVSVVIKPVSQGGYLCELKYLARNEGNGPLVLKATRRFKQCSDAAVITTNVNNFFNTGASVNTYLITANYGTNKIIVYRFWVDASGTLKHKILRTTPANVFTSPPDIETSGPNANATYLYAVADKNLDQAGYFYPEINLNSYLIGFKGVGQVWFVKNTTSADVDFENYTLLLSGNKFQFGASLIDTSLAERILTIYRIQSNVLSSGMVVKTETYPSNRNLSPLNTVELILIGNVRYFIYRNPLKRGQVYKINPGANSGTLVLSVPAVESLDSSAFQSKLETVTIKNSTQGRNPTVPEYEDTSLNFIEKPSTRFNNDSRIKFVTNIAIKIRVAIGNLQKGIIIWIQKARTSKGKFVSILAYVFTKKTSNDGLGTQSEVVYSTPVGDDTADKQLNNSDAEAESIPSEALDGNTEVVDVDVIVLPAKEDTKPTYVIKLETYLKDSNTYSTEILSGDPDTGLSPVDSLIKLVDTYGTVRPVLGF